MPVEQWLLTDAERGNDHSELVRRHAGPAWSAGNDVHVLVHGRTYFARLRECVERLTAGDLLLFTDWRGDPDERLAGDADSEVSKVFCRAAERGVVVKGLVWRSHWDRLQFSAEENRHLGESINAAGGECIRDMRVRPGGSHHQKFVVLRHRDRPEEDVAFIGGIDLCHSRNDDITHHGDPQRQPMAAVYGPRPPWHDIQLEIRGPAVGDLEASFRERWDDPAPVTRNPAYRLADRVRHDDDSPDPLPEQFPDPPECGRQTVQVLRTYPKRRPGYRFAPRGERSIARGYLKAVGRASRLIYVEDQYFWADDVVTCFADALRSRPELRLMVVVPRYPDQDGRVALPMNLYGREQALHLLTEAGGDRVGVYSIENEEGTPIYVHAKACVIDDVWAAVGSDNVNRRSWTHDSEISCAVVDEEPDEREPRQLDGFGDGARRFARALRLELAREHLGRAADDDDDLLDPKQAFESFRDSAERLEHWYAGGRSGPRPAGRLRPYRMEPLKPAVRALVGPFYRLVADPDGRPLRMRWRNAY
jgi:phosphatidylserine/phosphatidylglycerophosphate/cardiolipin synthase-like enzyme